MITEKCSSFVLKSKRIWARKALNGIVMRPKDKWARTVELLVSFILSLIINFQFMLLEWTGFGAEALHHLLNEKETADS